jgi:predicted ribosomally synthesized peptide with nif11-like leader
MSTSQAVEFIKRVDSDQSIQARVKALSPTDPAGLIMLGKALGYQFGAADFKAAAESLGRYGGELSNQELDQIAGGGGVIEERPPVQASLNFANTFHFDSPR